MSVFPQNMSMPSISISSVLFTALAVMVGTLLNEALAIAKKLIPQQLLLSKLESLIGKYYSQMTLIIDEHINGVSINEMFQASEIYLCAKISPSVERLKVSKALGEEALRVTVDQGERIVDTYIGIQLTWQMICTEKTKTSTDNEIVEYRSIELSFYKKYTEMVLSTYLPYVLERSKAMKEENKIGKLYSCKGSRSSVNLNHPSTFHTLVTDPSLKKKLMDDLNAFLKRGGFYWRVGKAWKRGTKREVEGGEIVNQVVGGFGNEGRLSFEGPGEFQGFSSSSSSFSLAGIKRKSEEEDFENLIDRAINGTIVLAAGTVSIPLILSLPATVFSLTRKDQLKIKICIMLCFFFKLDLAGETALSLSANHLQKLRLSFQLTTPLGHPFKPLQVCILILACLFNNVPSYIKVVENFVCLRAFLKLKHETKVEHIFILGNSGEQFEITLVTSSDQSNLKFHFLLVKIYKS
ncbi:Protein HYPER-SENSITIVITY-RELATED 4 [Camellia lanceoleosa]|uniref:Protein HYPER-SENSITIVITY-RELATED 4 n=1 Tax=Camellia lanceoleosa TaxID=1840588 RepID=A0ACC0I868_9ERIC|nr:Protein HYPER-SENSITIVITY-RELATED 4 [Camellia lanceoleosa]